VKSDETDTIEKAGSDSESNGLPFWWEAVWELDMMKTGEPGSEIIFGDSARVFKTNIEQIYGGYPSLDGCPLAEGELADIADGTMFVGLQQYMKDYGSPYKLCFGPKSFLVISDPVQARHMLRDANVNYDKVQYEEVCTLLFLLFERKSQASPIIACRVCLQRSWNQLWVKA